MLFERIGLVDENFGYRENMYVGTSGDRIVYVGAECPPENEKEWYGETYDGKGKVLMPGFVNAHGHSPMSLMRGYGENLPLDRWLNELIFPFEAKLYSKAVYWGTLLTMAESIRYGIVSTSDMYYFLDDMIRAITTSGCKSNISRSVVNPMDKPENCIGFKELQDSIIMYHGFDDGRIIVDASIHAEYTNNDETVAAIIDETKRHDIRMHVHVAETESEVRGCMERHGGMTPVQYFDLMGMFDQPTNAAHCVWLNDYDIEILKEKNVTVASNPISNLKLASGICDVPKLYANGVNVAIGTDSSTSNNSLDFFEEMKMFALLGKVKSGDAAAMKPEQVLHSATRAGAIAQGRDNCGLVKEGYKADLIVVDTDVPNMQPVHNMINNLVYSACGKDIVMTMVDGRVLYRDGEYTTIDIEKTYAEVEKARKKILSQL
ncbi:MAG: amidohydrolase [Clostridiales bacterium]|nr:amidohydrolase [Candidatus Crickella merdequi]